MPSKVAKSVGKGYDGFVKTTSPATPEYKWLRDMGSVKSI
jgi:hypothetical protein